MANIDERIGQALRSGDRPVDGPAAFDHVARRKRRRRVTVYGGRALLAFVVIAGTATGGYALTRLVNRSDVPTPGTFEPGPSPTGGVGEDVVGICDSTKLNADVDGDGALDEVWVYSPSATDTCDGEDVGQRYVLHVSGGKLAEDGRDDVRLYGVDADLPECETPFGCELIASPDIDGDGAAELAVQTVFGASTQWFTLYDVTFPFGADGPTLARIEVAPPGDPWHEEFGSPPGPVLLARYGSVTHIHSEFCSDQEDGSRTFDVHTLLRTDEPGIYRLHTSTFRLERNELNLDSVGDTPVGEEGELFDLVQTPPDLCGSPVGEGGPTDEPTPSEGTTGPSDVWTQGYLCEVSSIQADLDGDGSLDGVDVFAKVDPSAESCETAPDLGDVWGIRAQLSEAEVQAQPLPECQQEVGSCAVVGGTDINGDGRQEVLVRIGRGATTDRFTLYLLDGGKLRRIDVAPPGDEWESEYGLVIHPGPLEMYDGGGSRYPQTFGCRDGLLVTAASEAIDQDTRYHTHWTMFRLEGTELRVVDSADEYGPFDGEPPREVGVGYCGVDMR